MLVMKKTPIWQENNCNLEWKACLYNGTGFCSVNCAKVILFSNEDKCSDLIDQAYHVVPIRLKRTHCLWYEKGRR